MTTTLTAPGPTAPGPVSPAPTGTTEPTWGRVLCSALARMLLTTAGCLVVWSLVPALIGWTPQVIMSGSMEPAVHPGDIIVTRTAAAATLTEGQVVTVRDPDHPGRTRTHRFVRLDADGRLVLRGDANRQPDSSHVDPHDLLGLGVLRVPFVGRPLLWASEGNWLGLAGLLVVGGWCVANLRSEGGGPRGNGSGGSRPVARDGGAPRRTRRTRRVASVTAALTVAVGVGAGPAQAAFTRTAVNAGNSLAAATSFYPYRTAVLADSPSFLWRLNETSGSAVDDTTSAGRDGTLIGQTYSQGQTGALASEVRDKSLSTTIAAINANAAVQGPSAFSVEAWVKSSSTSGGRILGFGNASGQNPSSTVDRQLYLAPSGKVMFGVGSSKTAIASTSAVTNGAWHHVVGTYTSGSNGMRLYVDGVLQGSATATAVSMSGTWRAAAESMSGWPGNPSDQYYEGGLDELAVYPTALSATRVQAHYNAGATA